MTRHATHPDPATQGGGILCVCRDPGTRRLLDRYVKTGRVYLSAVDALLAAARERPAAVVLAFDPGVVSARQVVAAFRRTQPSVPVYGVVRAEDEPLARSLLGAGLADYLVLPRDARRLPDVIAGQPEPGESPGPRPSGTVPRSLFEASCGLADLALAEPLPLFRDGSRLILDALERGDAIQDIYLHVFQPVQREVGRLWQTNQVHVAQEHYITAATQLIMSQLYPYVFGAKRRGRRVVAACVGGELHEIGMRMVADFFEMEGWDTYYLGANTPKRAILHAIDEQQPDVLALSATMTFHISDVTGLIARVRAHTRAQTSSRAAARPYILVGGYPFVLSPDLWERVGADGYARDAQEAVAVANQWMDGQTT